MKKLIAIFAGFLCISSLSTLPCLADCPNADLNGDCKVDFIDFASLAGQWLTFDDGTPPQDCPCSDITRDCYAVRGAAPSPRLTRLGVIKHVEDFSDTVFGSAGHWTSNSTGTPTVSSDTTNYQCTDGTTLAGTKIQTLASGTEAKAYKYFASPVDVNNCHLVFDFYLPTGSGGSLWSNITLICINLKDTSGAEVDYKIAVGGLAPGWLSFSIPLKSGSGTLKLNLIQYITVDIFKVEGTTPAITCGRMMFYSQPTTPGIVCFGFDGAYATQKRAAMYLNSKGMVGTFYVTKSIIGGGGRMIMDDLHQLKQAGHLIACYPYVDGIYWQNKTLQQKKDSLRIEGKWLADNGFGNGAKIVSTPGSGGNQADDYALLMGSYLDVLTGYGSGRGLPSTFNNLNSLPYTVGPDGTTHIAQLTATATDHGIVMFIFHACDYPNQMADDVTYAYFKSVVDAAKVLVDAGTLIARTPSDIIYGNWN